MLFRLIVIFFALVFINFIGCSSALASAKGKRSPKTLDLCRIDEGKGGKVLLEQYAENLAINDPTTNEPVTYNLNFKTDREFVREAWNYDGTARSHIFANGFYVYEGGTDIRFRSFTTKTFFKVGIGDKDLNLKIDWMSATDKREADDDVYFRESHDSSAQKTLANCYHSERQLIADINDLWKTKPNLLVEPFIARSYKNRPRVIMGGLELYGSLDICTACLRDLMDFRKGNQDGATSISRYIFDVMGDKHVATNPEDRFVVIYHARFPYGTTFFGYDAEDKEPYKFERGYTSLEDMNKGWGTYKTKEKKFKKGDILSQTENAKVRKDVIYGHLHSLSGREAVYDEITDEDNGVILERVFAYKPPTS